MNINIKGTNLDLTDPIKQYVNDKVSSLDKYIDDILTARVELERDAHHQKGDVYRCEVNLEVPQSHLLRADSTEEDLYAAIDTVIPKLVSQIKKYKEKHHQVDRRVTRYLKSIFPWRRR